MQKTVTLLQDCNNYKIEYLYALYLINYLISLEIKNKTTNLVCFILQANSILGLSTNNYERIKKGDV
jgi:hypothetical protein